MEEEKVILNDEALTPEQFQEKKKEIEKTNDVKLVKITEKTHKTRLHG